MLNKKGSFLLLLFPAFCLTFLIFGCANRQLPQGGPKDVTPPKLLKASPPNMTRNFKAKVIQMDFDEFFKLTGQYTEITMSPTPAKQPEYLVRKKSLYITLKDTLEKNTTYVINFGKAISDVNAGNVLKNFTYVFGTGIHIDSLSISGTVINNQTQERERDATVMLFTLKQDSLLFGKKKPTVFTTTDSAGHFSLNNLHPDNYRLYALKEAAPNKIYDNDEELIGFNTKTIHLTTDTADIQLKLFKQTPEKFRLPYRQFASDGSMLFTFNRPLDNPSVYIHYPQGFDSKKIVFISKTKDTAIVYNRNMDFDSIRVSILDNNKPLDTIYLRKGRKETFIRTILFQYNINGNGTLKPGSPLIMKSLMPIETFDPALIELKEDSTDITNFILVRDTADLRVFTINYRWKQRANYQLTFGEGAFTDIYGGKSKRLPIKRFQLDKVENYGQLNLAITVPDTGKQYIVELLDDRRALLHSDIIRKNTTLFYKNYLAGKYRVRVIYDDNKNGHWDSGNVKRRKQPENIWVDETVIPLRPNWEQTIPIAIPKEPITP